MSLNKILHSRFWPAAWRFFVIIYAQLLLTLLGWGVDDLPGFFLNPIRMTFGFMILLQAMIGAWLVLMTPPQPKQEQPVDIAHWQMDMYHVVFIVAAYGDRRNILTWAENPPLQWLGLGIYLAGAALSVWANLTWINHLRRRPEPAQVDSGPIFEGPYQLIRYPGLLSIIIYCLGFSLAFRSWTGLVLWIPLIAGFMHRIKTIERDFPEPSGPGRRLPKRASKRLFPFLY